MSTFITFKRWTLRDGRQESELVRLVREEIVPHYRTLPGCMRLGLLHIVDTRSYLTLQYWKNRDVWQETTNSAYHEVWQREYEPIVERFAGGLYTMLHKGRHCPAG